MCVFCELDDSLKLLENEHFFVIKDKRPVSRGHVLIISKRHFETYFALRAEELTALYEISLASKASLDEKYEPTGYNLAINHGQSAGQTVFHFHMHIIPRYG